MEVVKEKAQLQKYPAYKDSGVEWLGEIPENWTLRRFKYLFKEINERSVDGTEDLLSVSQYTGVTRKGDKIEEGDLLTNASSLEGYKKVQTGDLVTNIMLAWNGSLGFSPFEGITSPAYSIYRLQGNNDERFFHYLLRTDRYKAEFKRNSSGVIESRLRLYSDDFFRILSLLPPKQEQTAIANFLDEKCGKIDTAIAQKQQLIELLKERRQIVIQEVVTGKKVWNAAKNAWTEPVEVKDSGVEWIGEIPAHWEVKKMTYVCKIDTGATPDRSNGSYWNGDIPWIKTGEVNYDIIYSTEEFITEKGLKNSATRLAPKGTLLMAMYGQGITRGRVSLLGVEAAYNQACCAMLFNEEIFNRYAFHFFVMAYSYIRDGGNETSQMNISAGYISNLKILQPPLSEQKEIANYIENASQKIDKAIDFQQQQIEKLKEYKGSLIDAAVTGKVKVG